MDHQAYKVGWICALPEIELPAAEAMLDEEFPDLEKDPADSNVYAYGRIGPHNVVIACLPPGQYGTASAATVAQDMLRTFPSIEIRLMVGVGGGLPNPNTDIRLGDIVVGQPAKRHGGVVQYDMGRASDGGKFERRGHLDVPPVTLLHAIGKLQSRHARKDPEYLKHLSDMLYRNPRMAKKFGRPDAVHDLQSPGVARRRNPAIQRSSETDLIQPEPPRSDPSVHYGLIASGNEVVASVDEAKRIEQLIGDGTDILCFEMEAAGLVNNFHCAVIRGISDYADALKDKLWQPYAAAAAAAYAKELVIAIPAQRTVKSQGSPDAAEAAPERSAGGVYQGGNTFSNNTASNSHFFQGNFNGRDFNNS